MNYYSLALISWTVIAFGATAFGEESLTFERDIRPILREHCFDCHGAAEELKGDLDLRLARFMAKGGKSGAAIVPGKPRASYLIKRLRKGEMPPGDARVSDDDISTIERWVAAGAPTARPEPESIAPGIGITPEERSFWSFQPVQRRAVPFSPGNGHVRTPIDAFLLEAMPEGLAFSEDADRVTLVRRAYFDLLGLQPAPEAMERWLEASRDDWYESLIDELLASPHYGERWARHWLDVAGYADSEGVTAGDSERPWAWKYRDWVVRALNGDMPFDRFVTEQLAGDELADPLHGTPTEEQIELLIATGFLRMAADGTGDGQNSPEARNQVLADTIKIVGSALLGLSIHCAQCHDHRYDPIPQSDYYALRGIFEPALDWQAWKTPNDRRISLYSDADRKRASEVEEEALKVVTERGNREQTLIGEQLQKKLLRLKDESLRDLLRRAYHTPKGERSEEQNALLKEHPYAKNLTPDTLSQYSKEAAEELKKYDARIREIRGKKPPEDFLRALVEPANHAPETRLFFRGDPQQPKEVIQPAALTITAAAGQRRHFVANDPSRETTGRRLAFAKWLTCGKHPLVTRVIVNRVWMHHFGRAIVGTPSDFGKLGTRPAFLDLLDWLADEFVRQGWSLKKLHRLIMTSTVWRQSSEVGPDSMDPTNHFYGRKPLVRLEAEALRDRMLAASGELDRQLYGSPLALHQDEAGQIVVAGDQRRRSLYIQVRRSRPVGMMQSFDAPVMETNCESRTLSTAATQSLILMNGGFILSRAAKMAQRVARETPVGGEERLIRQPEGEPASAGVPEAQIVHAWRLALSRPPTREEIGMASGFLEERIDLLEKDETLRVEGQPFALQAMTSLCQVLLSSNEFLYMD